MFNKFTFDNAKKSLAALAFGTGMLAFGMSAGAGETCAPVVAGDENTHTEILYAGQTIEAGTVTMAVEGQNHSLTFRRLAAIIRTAN